MSPTVWLLEDNKHLNLFWAYHKKVKITIWNWKRKQEQRIVSHSHTYIHIHHSCWIYKDNKPIGTYTSPDLQLQLGPEERWVNFSTLRLVYWYFNRVCLKTGRSASQFPTLPLCRKHKFSFSCKNFSRLLPSLKRAPRPIWNSLSSIFHLSQLIEDL